MPFLSSPIRYPPTSSPREEQFPRKRRKVEQGREPLRSIQNEAAVTSSSFGGFVVDDDDDEDNDRLPCEGSFGNGEGTENKLITSENFDSRNQRAASPSRNPAEAGEKENGRKELDEPFNDRTQKSASQKCTESRLEDLRSSYFPSENVHVAKTSRGVAVRIHERPNRARQHYEQLVAARSTTVPNQAQKSYYGIDIHHLVDEANAELQIKKSGASARSNLPTPDNATLLRPGTSTSGFRTHLWTEKYRAKKFTDLVGDERTHRSVLRWLKGWDYVVFPHQSRPGTKKSENIKPADRQPRKVLLMAGPPGLGKTTLAHVCAKQAGYETQEINASDERSRDVVKGRIRDMVGTENVRSFDANPNGNSRKVAKPVCVVVDEVDGVVGGSGGGGEGGFIKALVDLLELDQKNSHAMSSENGAANMKKRKGDKFRLMRPLILICNDIYHPSLRLLRKSFLVEIVHVRRPPLSMVVPRMQAIFEKEGVRCDSNGVRRLCEAAWGVASGKEGRAGAGGTCEGDIRGILVVGEWVARRFKTTQSTSSTDSGRLSKQWLEKNVVGDLAHGGGAARSIGRGSSKDIVEKIFVYNAGFTSPNPSTARGAKEEFSNGQGPVGVAEAGKKHAMQRLLNLVDGCGEDDKVVADVFASYPTRPFQDDTTFTKPTLAHDWIYYHEMLSHRVHTAQEWDLAPYLSYPILALHNLFASAKSTIQAVSDPEPAEDQGHNIHFTASQAFELARANDGTLTSLHQILNLPLQRSFRGNAELATELLPYVLRLLNPDVKPTLIGGMASVRRGPEKERVMRAVDAMCAVGIRFERGRVETSNGDDEETETRGHGLAVNTTLRTNAGWIYRMEPPLDELGVFASASPVSALAGSETGKVRYAVRQVLEQEWRKEIARREAGLRMKRAKGYVGRFEPGDEVAKAATSKEAKPTEGLAAGLAQKEKAAKRDFFGRPIASSDRPSSAGGSRIGHRLRGENGATDGEAYGNSKDATRVWVTYNEGYSNAVKKGITLKELLEGL